ncbi:MULTISPECIES: vitamin K epoxide reductase family protein [unclassified Salinibacterium]|uniref:vitamin K epoxide reductase family protein n=1 Tax=unclassified Salinibacterium TaxID=2632331 RepID=UPI0018CD712D|nr:MULTISPECIES: vitamin K epoxide reductase family protein [unclassified Salinibacterium]MBH0053931.1 vitamin K epoxide reductase family protein [Salinibacterium sp. SWN139]MBH0083212.1 vitamin K epoxide reductase family protein [Salinibacterium sp. SWN167]
MTASGVRNRPIALAIFLIFAGVVGLWASFQLTLEKLHVLQNPDATLSCDFSIVVQCAANLESAQGALFGFPNPIIGLVAFMAPVVVGAAILAGARFNSWFWVTFNLGVAGAFTFILWLAYQSIFNIGTLCPWCMVVWSVTIPMFWAVTLRNLKVGAIPAPRALRKAAGAAYSWVPVITIVGYIIIAIVAQYRLDVLAYL